MAERTPGDRLPRKSLGQHFLVDTNLQRKIVDAIQPGPDDEVLEIGPGHGALTRHLAGRVRRLVLVELDDALAARLEALYQDDATVTVVHRDILDVELGELAEEVGRLKVIGNIPYNITTPIIFHLLERRRRPREIVLMVQREVAERILAAPGGKTFGALAVGVQSVADVERIIQVPRGAFRPPPDVDSTVVRIVPHTPTRLSPGIEVALRTLTRMAFGQRRKQFQRILRDGLNLTPVRIAEIEETTGFDLRRRPETFPPTDFVRLTEVLVEQGLIRAGIVDGTGEAR